MSSKRTVGSAEYLEKRIPQNPKYQHVKTKLDTGCSLSKYMERVEEIKKNYRFRKDELFKRLKVTTFAQLVLQVASVSDLNEGVADEESICSGDHLSLLTESESVGSLSGDPSDSPLPLSPCQHQQHHHHHHHNHHQQHHKESGHASDSPRSTLHGVISGVGELDLERNDQKTLKAFKALTFCQYMSDRPYPDCPYLLLDTRPRAEYDLCHVISASSFPIAMLSRTMNPYTKEVLEYKNAVGRIIILYDDDERIASQAATTMCERGFENIFMLSGGLKVLTKKFPEGMTTGHAPAPLLPSSTEKPTQVRKCRFTFDDLDKIQQQLQEVLIPSGPNSRMSSRMSTNSFGSKASSRLSSSASEKESARVQGRPWK